MLPFVNLSPDPDNAYFAGGIHEEVLAKLARMSELRIISRTSMERIALEKLDVGASLSPAIIIVTLAVVDLVR